MSHEATHVATDAAFSPTPLWLLEGFADYVALRDVDLPLTTTAADHRRRYGATGPPRRCPVRREFEATDAHLGARRTRPRGWPAGCSPSRAGSRRWSRFYRRRRRGRRVDAALRGRFGLDWPRDEPATRLRLSLASLG